MVSKGSQVRTHSVDASLKRKPEKLPWPRTSGTVQLGVDVVAKKQDIIKLVHKFFKVEGVPMEELLQEVYTAIIHKNYTKSAHDPRKSSFGHYIYMVANNVCINLVHKKKRYDRERDSIDAPSGHDDDRSLLETYEAQIEVEPSCEHIDDFEENLRKNGKWEMARYVRAIRSGAGSDVIRQALSWGSKEMSVKGLKDLKDQIKSVVTFVS